jgi:molecular chaperone DnaK
MTKLIEKNTTIPAQASQVFSTAEDNQAAVTVHVLQGEREQATYNKSLGQFNLEGISPAPRGIPQIEVKFDIDANGILNVSAKDGVTGKEQSVVIKASSGLSEEEVERMVKEAEVHAEDDRKFHELVTARNQAEALVHTTNKTLEELGSQISASDRNMIEAIRDQLETAVKGENVAEIEEKSRELSDASAQLANYQQAQQGASGPAAGAAGDVDDEVIDAEFEDVPHDQNHAA